MEQKSNGKIFHLKSKFLNFLETKNFSTESFNTESFSFRELQPLVSYKQVSCKKKSHTSEEGGAHFRISFWHLLMNLKNK